MKSKKKSIALHHRDIMVEGMMFCIKTFATVCVATSLLYFAASHIGTIIKYISL